VFGQLLPEEAHPAPEPYSFAFSSPNEDGTSSSREETGDANGRIVGSYTIQGADGQQRRVEYVADENGFRANVITNEIGTESQPAADVQYVSSAPTAAELSHQWEASGAGKARLAIPQPGVGPVLARPVLKGAIGVNRGVGLVSAPIAPIVGGVAGVQNLRFNQGLGIRAEAPIAPVPIAGYRAVAVPAPIAPVAPIAPIAPKVAAVQTGFARGQGFGSGLAFGVTPLGFGANQLDFNQLNLGAAPLGLNYGDLGPRANLGTGANVLFLTSGQPQLVPGASTNALVDRVEVKSDAFGRKY
jgi:hypothetical protein